MAAKNDYSAWSKKANNTLKYVEQKKKETEEKQRLEFINYTPPTTTAKLPPKNTQSTLPSLFERPVIKEGAPYDRVAQLLSQPNGLMRQIMSNAVDDKHFYDQEGNMVAQPLFESDIKANFEPKTSITPKGAYGHNWDIQLPKGSYVARDAKTSQQKMDEMNPASKFINKAQVASGRMLFGDRYGNQNVNPGENVTTGNAVADVASDIVGGTLGLMGPGATGLTKGPANLLGPSNAIGNKLVQKVLPKGLSKTPPIVNKAITGAAEGAATMMPISAYQSVTNNDTPVEALKRLGTDALIGAGFGAGLSGLGQGVKALKDVNLQRKFNKAINSPELPNEYIKFQGSLNNLDSLRPDVRPSSLSGGKYKIANKGYDKAVTDYENAVTDLQNKFRTNDLTLAEQQEAEKILNPLIDRMAATEGLTQKDMLKQIADRNRFKQAAGLADDSVYGLRNDIRMSRPLRNNNELPVQNESTRTIAENVNNPISDLQARLDAVRVNRLNEIISRGGKLNKHQNKFMQTQLGVKIPNKGVNPQVSQPEKPSINNTINQPYKAQTTGQQKVYTEPNGTKQSAVKTNTLRNAEWTQDKDIQKVIDDMDATYEVKTDKETINRVSQMLNNDYSGTYNRILKNGVQSKEDIVASGAIARDMIKNGDTDALTDFVKKSIQPEVTNAAQMVQAMSTFKPNTLEGAVFNAEKISKQYEKLFKQTRPEQFAKVESKIKSDVEIVSKLLDDEISKGLKIDLQLFGNKLKEVAKLPKDYVEKIIKTALKTDKNGRLSYNIDDLTDIMKERYKIPTVTKEDTKKMLGYWKEAQKHAPDSYEYRANMYKMATVLPDKIPSTIGDYFRAIQALNLFGNTKTLSKILAGNTFSTSVKNLEQLTASLIDKGVGLFTGGKRTIVAPSLKTQVKGGIKRTGEIIKDYKNNVDTNIFNDTFDYRYKSPFKGKYNPFRAADNVSRTAFGLVENTFKQGIYDDVLRQQLKIHNINAKKAGKELLDKPTKEMIDIAKTEAEKAVFANNNILVDNLYALRSGINKVTNFVPNEILKAAGKGSADTSKFGIGNLLLPVLRTPANFVAWAGEHLPVNPQLVKGIIKSVKGNEGRKDIIEGIVKGAFGTGIGVAGYKMAKEGMSFGAPDKDKDARNFNTERGQQANSVNIGDKNTTIDWMQPYSMPYLFGTEIGQDKKNKSPVSAAVNALLSQSFMQSINTALGGGNRYGDRAENIGDAVLNTGTQLVPFGGLVNQFSKSLDSYKRETDNSPLNRIIARTPLRATLPAKTDMSGNKVKEDSLIDTWFNPSTTKDIKNNPTNTELNRLYKENGEVKQFISKMPENKTIKKNQIMFSSDEQIKAQQEFSNNVTSKFSNTINSSKYINAKNDEERALILSGILEKEKKQILDKLIRSKGISTKTGKPKQ